METMTPAVEWGVATRTLEGESESGDRHLVRPLPGGMLLAAVDGIGHGREAALAAQLAIEIVDEHAGEPLARLLGRCHERLRPTRGVVMGLAAFDAAGARLTWLGVGNVEGVLQRSDPRGGQRRERLLQRPGVVGGRMPPLQEAIIPVAGGDVLIFITDGVDSRFDEGFDPYAGPQRLAERILQRHAKGTDDATVLVARFGERR
jgi:hypothetical protein